jgi:hypothetical protein
MAFDSLGRYVPNHKSWDHVGNAIPVVEHSEGIRPHGEFKPAAWLPVQFYDKYYEVHYVTMPGKLVACDNQGRIVPAQYGLSGADITYTDTDVEAGVIDVRTGSALLSAATGTFAVSGVTDFMGTGETFAVSAPIGAAPYAYFQWAGDGSSLDDGFNPGAYREHNHNLQHRVAVVCDYVLELPLVPASATSENLENSSHAASVLTLGPLNNLPVAANTVRTPITFADNTLTDSATRFVREVDALADVTTAGDWHINLETGVISVYASSDPGGGATAYSVSYSHYASAPTGSSVSKFASAVGDLTCGQFLVCNSDSNWAAAGASDTFQDIMGQVLEIENVLDKDALGRVRTAYNPALGTDAAGSLPAYAGQMDQMPGSATGGAPDKVHYAGAADLVVRINMISR